MAASNPTQLRHLLPEDGVLFGWKVIEDARAFAGLDPKILEAVLDQIGDPGLTNMVLLAGIDPATIRQIIRDLDVEDARGNMVKLKPLQRTQIALVYNGARARFAMELEDVISEPTLVTQPSVIAATGGAGAPPAINPLLKVKMASVMDQASDVRCSSCQHPAWQQCGGIILRSLEASRYLTTTSQMRSLPVWYTAWNLVVTPIRILPCGGSTGPGLKGR